MEDIQELEQMGVNLTGINLERAGTAYIGSALQVEAWRQLVQIGVNLTGRDLETVGTAWGQPYR